MNRGRRGEHIYTDHADYQLFVNLLEEATEQWNIHIAAYCLMPNHYHILIHTPEANISRCMRHINGVYTQRFNRRHQCDGQLFRGRYKSILIDADSYLLQLVRYIHRNPLSAGLTDKFKTYPWSSHKGYVSNAEKWNWLYKDYPLAMLSKKKAERIKRYRRFVSMENDKDLSLVFAEKKWPSLLGTDNFIQRIKEAFYTEKSDDEVPQARELAPEYTHIKYVVCRFYGISEDELIHSRRGVFNEPRNVAIYLARRYRNENLKEIGDQFQINKYSSVSSVVERMKKLMAQDRKLRKRVEQVMSMI